jgi:cytochrome c-type biogenesis protein CcmF
MMVFTLAVSFLLLMVSPWFKNPFELIWTTPTFVDLKSINSTYLNLPFLQQFLFSDQHSNSNFVQVSPALLSALVQNGIDPNTFIINGRGLNPQLLNFWMQVHPPVLFVGFAMATVPFSFAVSALMKNEYKDWVNQSFPWLLAATGILGLGIMLGGYWAYEMLGWGGYWAWDPVENSSLIPWIIGVAAIHTMIVQRESQAQSEGLGRYTKTNLILNILVFVLVLYSTFLTRSGVLGDASVHSFVDPGMLAYLLLVIFIGSFTLLGIGLIFYRWRNLKSDTPQDEGLLSRELSLFTAAVVLCASAIIVFVGTSAPIVGRSVDISFYNEMHIPLAIIIGLLNGLSLLLKWKNTSTEELIRKSIIFFAISVVLTILLVVFSGIYDLMMIILAFSAIFTILINGEIAIKIIKNNFDRIGGYVAHIGLAIFILGVIGSSAYSSEKTLNLVKGKPTEVFGYEMTFTGYEPIANTNKYAFNIEMKKDGKIDKAAPVMYIAEYNNSLMREPSIRSFLTKDIYIAPISFEQSGEHSHSEVLSIQKGKSETFENVSITFETFKMDDDVMKAMQEGRDFQLGAVLTAKSGNKNISFSLFRKQSKDKAEFTSFESKELNLRFDLINLSAQGVELSVSKLDEPKQTVKKEPEEILVVTAAIKPFVILVWIGVVVVVIGFFISASKRLKESF